jgi:hypothetical protein
MLSLIAGGITHHYIASSSNYCNRFGNTSTIHNPFVMALKGDYTSRYGFILGQDSACGIIAGPVAAFGLNSHVDFIAGAYNVNYDAFRKIKVEPLAIMGVTPIAGFNLKFPIYKSKEYTINSENLISTGTITHALSVNF